MTTPCHYYVYLLLLNTKCTNKYICFSYRIIRRRVVWLCGQWVGVKMSASLRPTLYQALIPLLEKEEDFVVRLEAAQTLKTDILSVKYLWTNHHYMNSTSRHTVTLLQISLLSDILEYHVFMFFVQSFLLCLNYFITNIIFKTLSWFWKVFKVHPIACLLGIDMCSDNLFVWCRQVFK